MGLQNDKPQFRLVVVQFDKEASQARDYWVAKNATLRAARPDPSRRKERLLKDDNQTAPLPFDLVINGELFDEGVIHAPLLATAEK